VNVRYRVELSQTERAELMALLSAGKHAARKPKRAQILLAADAGASDEDIAVSVGVGGSTVYWTKRRFVLGNLEAALREEPRPEPAASSPERRKLSWSRPPCSKLPRGRARWTLELLAGELVRLTEHETISRETMRRRLAENDLKPWRKDMWCIPQVDGEYVARMEDVLDLHAEEFDPKRPVVCFDESPTQLMGEVREPIPAAPGQLEWYDCEYKRNGTPNLFIFLDVHRPWRRVRSPTAAPRWTSPNACASWPTATSLTPNAFGSSDNLSRHHPGSLYQAFPPGEARRVLRRPAFHYAPKHVSWLSMVEIEVGVLRGQCRDRRIATRDQLATEIAAWQRQRNASGGSDQMDVHDREGARQNGAGLSGPRLGSQTPDQRVIIIVQLY
jgi:hypothetical protein